MTSDWVCSITVLRGDADFYNGFKPRKYQKIHSTSISIHFLPSGSFSNLEKNSPARTRRCTKSIKVSFVYFENLKLWNNSMFLWGNAHGWMFSNCSSVDIDDSIVICRVSLQDACGVLHAHHGRYQSDSFDAWYSLSLWLMVFLFVSTCSVWISKLDGKLLRSCCSSMSILSFQGWFRTEAVVRLTT